MSMYSDTYLQETYTYIYIYIYIFIHPSNPQITINGWHTASTLGWFMALFYHVLPSYSSNIRHLTWRRVDIGSTANSAPCPALRSSCSPTRNGPGQTKRRTWMNDAESWGTKWLLFGKWWNQSGLSWVLSIYLSIYLSVYLFSLSLFIAPPRLHADTKGELDHLIELEWLFVVI